MDFSESDSFTPQSSSTELSTEQEFIINKTLLTHEVDRHHVDCKILFQAMENVMFFASNTNNAVDASCSLDSIENFALKETVENAIYKISRAVILLILGRHDCVTRFLFSSDTMLVLQILCKYHNTADMHARTIALLEMLGKYRWDAKVVLILTAFAISYGEFRLILDVHSHNSLAASLAVLKNLSWRNFEALRPQLKAMEMLIKEMMELAECVVRFEGLPQQLILYDDHEWTLMASTKSQIYLATYWIVRSSLTSACQITDLIAMEQENSNITANAAWGLSSLALKLSRLRSCLRMQVDASQEKTEQILYRKIMELVTVHTRIDNQELFHLFFSFKDDFPLKDSSSSESKVGISRLKHKIVMLLVSKPDLCPIDQTLLLLQQTHEHPHHKNIEQDYEIVWVPVSSSETWTLAEHISFDCLSNTLPWLSIRQPWLLNSAIVKIIREEWKFEQEPLMVVLDPQGLVANYNALSMVLIWGAKAFPFTDSREKELWEEEHWNVKLMLDGIDHFLTKTVERDQNICICGSSNLEWTKEFKSGIKKLEKSGLQLQVIYVGSRNTSENMQTTLSFLNRENSFTHSKIRLFWLRLEKIKDSIVRVGQIQSFTNYENLLKQVSELLDTDDHQNHNWAVFGCASSKDFVKLEGNKITELFDLFPVWAEKVAAYGLVGAIKSAGKEDMSMLVCDHPTMVPYDEGLDQGPVVCDKCKRLIKPCVTYQCDGSQ